jgi:hypothetical protein
LTGKKKTNSDEFLVKKKNPLSLPPEFEKLPEPKTLTKNNDHIHQLLGSKGLVEYIPFINKNLTLNKIIDNIDKNKCMEVLKKNAIDLS